RRNVHLPPAAQCTFRPLTANCSPSNRQFEAECALASRCPVHILPPHGHPCPLESPVRGRSSAGSLCRGLRDRPACACLPSAPERSPRLGQDLVPANPAPDPTRSSGRFLKHPTR